MRLAPAFALALVPFAAGAVVMQVNGSHADVFIGKSKCKSTSLLASWDLQTTPTSGETIRFLGVKNSSSCTSNPPSPAAEFTGPNEGISQTGSDTFTANQLAVADGGTVGCDGAGIVDAGSDSPATTVFCLQYVNISGAIATDSVNVKYALLNPTPPVGLAISPGDAHLRVFWSAGNAAEDIATYDVHVVPQGASVTGNPAVTVTKTTNADVDKTDDGVQLANDAGYSVTVVAHDSYGNISDPSAPVVGVPVRSADFYEHYREDGGSALGGHGCTTGGASAWIAGGALALALLFRRRRNLRKGATLIALVAVLAPAARADEPTRRFLFAFKMDRYDPKVDSEPGLTGTPYHDVFGPRAPPRYQLEFDWEVAHPFGSLLAGATFGYWQNNGKTILVSSTGTVQQAQDTTTLTVFPFGLIATYRFDWLADRWERFPFIPYAQIGLMRALWVSRNGRGNVITAPQGGRGSGWTNGYTTALGIAVNLNAIDVDLAREAYIDTGIQRTSLFAEYGWTHLDDFHGSGALILTDHAWRFGLSVEF